VFVVDIAVVFRRFDKQLSIERSRRKNRLFSSVKLGRNGEKKPLIEKIQIKTNLLSFIIVDKCEV
jgi:hypothetical protein